MSELVFIRMDMEKEKVMAELDKYMVNDLDIIRMKSGSHFIDDWPI